MFKSVSTTDVAAFYKMKNSKWCEKVFDRVLVKEMTVEPRMDSNSDTEGDDVHGVTDTFTPKQRDLVDHTRSSLPKSQSGCQLLWDSHRKFEIDSYGNIKGLSLDEAIVCHHLTALDKWICIKNTTFLSSSWHLFIVGDLLLGPRGWDPVHVWERHRVWKQIPLLWDATQELCRRKDNQLQECLVSTNCWKKNPAPLEDAS